MNARAMPILAALIDLDGTLVDSIPDLAASANAMRVDLGRAPLSEDLLSTFVGKGGQHLIRRALAHDGGAEPGKDLLKQAWESFRVHYHRYNGQRTTVYAGARDGLTALREQGLRLAVVTNKPAEFTGPLLERTGLAGFFTAVVSGDTCARRKPDPDQILYACEQFGIEPRHAVMIGDSGNDTQAGRAAGARVLAVPYGYNEGQDVRDLDVDCLVADMAEAARWIARVNAEARIP
jgi:phosphoglycolate phosphatase